MLFSVVLDQDALKMQILTYYLSATVAVGSLPSSELHPPTRLRHTAQPGQDAVLGQSLW